MDWKIISNLDTEEGERLDFFLSTYFEDYSRSKISKSIKSGDILVNDKKVKPSYLVKTSDEIKVNETTLQIPPILPEKVELDIIYEDEFFLAINKPAGMIVHPTISVRSNTLVNALLGMNLDLSDGSDIERPGIVHRLDAETTGIILIAKTNEMHAKLNNLFKSREINKQYLAVVEGVWECENFLVDKPIARDEKNRKKMIVQEGGKSSRSIFTTLDTSENHSLMIVKIETGRTHQIRVHAKSEKHPVVGDNLYGYRKQSIETSHQLLHAYQISFVHPITGESMQLTANPDHEFYRVCKKLNLCLTSKIK